MLNKIHIRLLVLLISFGSYGQQDTTSVPQDSSAIQGLYNRILSLDQEIRNNPLMQTLNFNPLDTASLPVGIVKEIGNVIYVICIDSAKFTPQGAFFNVYMALDFPDSPKKVAFAAKNIQFNPQGVIVSNGARLQLVSQQVLNLGPKVQMIFKNNGKNFIEWDCNGYKQAGLSLDFVFRKSIFEHAINPELDVKASMEITVEDLNDITFQLSEITPFKIRGADDFVFHLQNIVIDRSEFTTPSGVNLNPESLALYNNNIDSWKGFYAESAIVTLPEKLSRKSQGNTQKTTVYAQNLIIDDSGLSGSFGANNLFSTSEGDMNGKWGFSVASINVDIANNHLIGGGLSGVIGIPILDNNSFPYTASVTQNLTTEKLDYNFIVSPSNQIQLNAFQSTLTLQPSSHLSVQSINGKFVPSIVMNGSWTIAFGKANVNGISFQNLSLTTVEPYFNSGTFSLVGTGASGSNDLVGLPISLDSIGMNFTSQNNLSFAVGTSLSLGGDNVNFGVSTTFRINTQFGLNSSGRETIEFNNFGVDDIGINLSTNAFELNGVISIKNDDPIFGDLFFGAISLKITNVLDNPIMVAAGFGKNNGNKYWFTDASIPITIPLVAGLKITSLYGGVQKGVSSTLTDDQMLDRVMGQIINVPNSGSLIPFVPDPTKGLVFRAGVGLVYTSEDILNGEVLFSVAFNPNGGLASIDFIGRAFMMVSRADRNKTDVRKVWGSVSMNYDNNNKIFDTQLAASILVPNFLTGGLSIKFHIDQNDWYFWLNRPSNRAYLSLKDVATINTYFMMGTQIDPIPPPPAYVTNLVGGGTINNIDLAEVGNGNGFATGVSFNVGLNKEFPKTSKWRGYVAVNIGGGFDLMMINVANARCSGSPNDPVGVNGYYLMGQVYAYLNGSLGARKYKNNGDGPLKQEYQLGSLQVAALLQGKLPKPTFVYGAIGVQVSIFEVINFGFTAEVEFGDDCQLVGI